MQANEENFFSASVPDASAIELCKAEGGVNAEENSRTYGSEDENFNNLPKRFMSSTSGAMAAGTSAGTENNIGGEFTSTLQYFCVFVVVEY